MVFVGRKGYLELGGGGEVIFMEVHGVKIIKNLKV